MITSYDVPFSEYDFFTKGALVLGHCGTLNRHDKNLAFGNSHFYRHDKNLAFGNSIFYRHDKNLAFGNSNFYRHDKKWYFWINFLSWR